ALFHLLGVEQLGAQWLLAGSIRQCGVDRTGASPERRQSHQESSTPTGASRLTPRVRLRRGIGESGSRFGQKRGRAGRAPRASIAAVIHATKAGPSSLRVTVRATAAPPPTTSLICRSPWKYAYSNDEARRFSAASVSSASKTISTPVGLRSYEAT